MSVHSINSIFLESIPSFQFMGVTRLLGHTVYSKLCLFFNIYDFDFFKCTKGRYGRYGQSTVCPRSSDLSNIVTYYIKWVTTSWKYNIWKIYLMFTLNRNRFRANLSSINTVTLISRPSSLGTQFVVIHRYHIIR